MNNDIMISCIANMLAVSLANVKDILSIVSIGISLAFTVFLIVRKIINYTKDGKLDKEEIEDLLKDGKEALDKANDLINKTKDGDDKNV